MMQPRLRFKEFHESWAVQNISEIADVKGGKRIPKGVSLQNEDNGLPYITVSDMSNQTVSQSNIRFVPLEVASQIKNYKISVHDIYISVAGTLGLVGVIPKDLDGANLTENANKLTNLKCNQKFLLHYLNTDKFKNLIDSTKTVGAQPKLAIYAINSFEVCLPSKNEQTKIASFFSAVDEKITQLTKEHELLSQFKKGSMQKIFSQELRFKSDDGSDYPDWVNKKIGEALTIGSGKDYKHLSEGDVPVYGTGGYMLSVSKYLYDGDSVGIGRKGTIDKPVFLTGKFWTVDTLFFTHSFKECLPKFIYYVFLGINWKSHSEASGVPSLSKSTIEKLPIFLPTIPEQTKIANFLSAIDAKIQNTKAQLDAAKQYKQGLLQQMFI